MGEEEVGEWVTGWVGVGERERWRWWRRCWGAQYLAVTLLRADAAVAPDDLVGHRRSLHTHQSGDALVPPGCLARL